MRYPADLKLAKPIFRSLREKRGDYWKSPEGIRRRVQMLGQGFTYNIINGALQAYGNKNVAGWIGVEGPTEHCEYCLRHIIGKFFRRGQFLPSLPAHFGCTCTWMLVWYEEPV